MRGFSLNLFIPSTLRSKGHFWAFTHTLVHLAERTSHLCPSPWVWRGVGSRHREEASVRVLMRGRQRLGTEGTQISFYGFFLHDLVAEVPMSAVFCPWDLCALLAASASN